MDIKRRDLFKSLLLLLVLAHSCGKAERKTRPNILLLMSDNHCWNHLGCYGDTVVRTPNIDRIAGQGVKFSHAFCASPSCSPARAGMLTGQDIWRLEEGANLWGILPDKFPFYTDLLEESGYWVGSEGKGWGPGSVTDSGRNFNHGGISYPSFEGFLRENVGNMPWCYWFSSRSPHRPYEVGSGVAAGLNSGDVQVPAYLPENTDTRGDICDYYYEIERFDSQVGEILAGLDSSGQRENTLIVICADNGWQMPRGLANLYDSGSRIPLIFSWPGRIFPGRTVDDFVNLNDLAPTFLELAGLPVPEQMTARSILDLLFSSQSGQIDPARDRVYTGRERHALCRTGGLGYPARAIRTADFLYIRNYEPGRWPGGDPPLFGDCDAHMLHYPCPTKLYLLAHQDDPETGPLFELVFGKRPAEELYDLRNDPDQMSDKSASSDYAAIKDRLAKELHNYLAASGDPRITGGEMKWEQGKYYETVDFRPRPSKEARELLGLEEEYNYFPE